MSWSNLEAEISEEFASSARRGREWLDADGYSFRRLEKLRDDDVRKLADARSSRQWRRRHPEWVREYDRKRRAAFPELFRAKSKQKAQRIKADPVRLEARRASARRWARKKYHQLKATLPAEQWQVLAERNRRNASRYYYAHRGEQSYRERRRRTERRYYHARKGILPCP